MDPNAGFENVPNGFPALLGPSVVVVPTIEMLMLPVSTYGISYDFYLKKIEDALPNGWATSRASVYATVCKYLRSLNYVHAQYSVWHLHKIAPVFVFVEMMAFRTLRPSGLIPSVLRRLQMYHIPNVIDFVRDLDMQMGGDSYPEPIAPTPRALTWAFDRQAGHNRFHGDPNPPPGFALGFPFDSPDNLPSGLTKNIQSAMQPQNWRLRH